MRPQTMKWGAGASIAGAALLALSALALSPVSGQTDSNEGTVKINGIEADAFPNFPANDPHVGCVFEVGFFGYPEGAPDASVVFSAQPPSGTGELITDTVEIGEDEAGGANDEDAVRTYDLTDELAGLVANEQQGYHIRLDVDAPNTQGGTKTKVFWVMCEAAPPTTSSTTTTSTTTTSTTAPTTTTTAPTTTTTAPTTTTTAPTTTTTKPSAPPGDKPPAPPGDQPPAPQAPAPSAGPAPAAPQAPAAPSAPGAPQAPSAGPAPSGELAFTGSSTSILAGVGGALLLAGAAMTVVARRRLAT